MADLTFNELRSVLSDVILLDVRKREEVIVKGQIPESHCVPLAELEDALGLDTDAFHKKYGFKKPDAGCAVVTHCVTGKRAQEAVTILKTKGYTNVRRYAGSYSDWLHNEGEIIIPGKPYQS